MGLVLVVLNASVGDPGLDLIPDPVGWALVLLGVHRLPERIAHRAPMTVLAALALVVSVLLWVPDVARELLDLEESFLWVLDLPTPLFVLVLARAVGAAAGRGGDATARTWWRVVLVGTVLTILLPPVAYAAQVVALAVVVVALAIGTLVTCLVLCFAHSARPWVHDAPATAAPPVG
jgi:hypothetical protein